MSEPKEKLQDAKARLVAFSKASPALFAGFTKISNTATQDGHFTSAQKELIATTVAISQGCEDCILYHVDAAKRQGADEAALIEALEIAVEMGGGPALMYAGKALDAYHNL